MNAAARLTPRRVAAVLPPAPKAAPHPIPVAPDPTADEAIRNVQRAARRRQLLDQIPAKLRPAHL